MLTVRRWPRATLAQPATHTVTLRVRFTRETDPYRQARIVAGQLRVLAVNTDGRPSIAGCFEAEIMDRGMRFRFSTPAKRDEFKGRVLNYLSRSVTQRLVFSA